MSHIQVRRTPITKLSWQSLIVAKGIEGLLIAKTFFALFG